MRNKQSFADAFNDYLLEVYPDGCIGDQFIQIRQAFYGGLIHMFAIMVTLPSIDGAPEYMHGLYREVEEFMSELDGSNE